MATPDISELIFMNQSFPISRGKEKFCRAAALAGIIGKGILQIEANDYRPLLLNLKYIQELKKSSVRLLNGNERPAFSLEVRNGKLFQDNRAYLTQGEPGKPSSHAFILSPDKRLYAAPIQPGKFHHSSFLAGGAVIFAGELETNSQGTLVTLSNRSGHYRPQKQHLLQALEILEQSGLDLKTVALQEYDSLKPNQILFFPSAKTYLDTLGKCPPENTVSF